MIEKVGLTAAGKKLLERKAKAVSTKLQYSKASLFLSEFLSKPIDELVGEYVSDVKANLYEAANKWEETFQEFTTWLENKKYKSASVAVYHAGAKSLINANVPRSMRLQAETPEAISRSIPGVTIEDLREIYAMCDDRERAFIAILKDSGISADDALRLNYGDVKGFDSEQFVHINVFREKEGIEYETFFGSNAVEALKAYTTIRKVRGENITPESPIFASEHEPYERLNGDALVKVFRRIASKTGKTISTHRLRKFFETYMALIVRHPIVLKYWMGHKVLKGSDIEARYIIPPTPEQLKLYMESYRNIDLAPKISAEELSEARIRAELETMNPEARKRYIGHLQTRWGLKVNMKKLIEDIRKEFDKEEDGDCPDGIHCERFEQINENNILAYLREGWQIVHRLGNGDVVMKRTNAS
jgi:integrase